MTLLSTLAGLAMAFGAPLVYADQAWSIQKRRSAEGFSKDVCAVLLIANISRVFFWFGERFEWALLLQSILMIVSQVFLLSLLLRFRPGSFASSAFSVSSGDRDAGASSGSAPTTPSTASRPKPASAPSAAEFAADDAFDGPNASDDNNSKTTFPPSSAGGLFGGGGASGGQYAPLFGLQMPAAPTLGYAEGEDEEEVSTGTSATRQRFQRAGRKTVRFFQAGMKRSESTDRDDGSSGSRIFGFWTWPNLSSYLLFLGALIVLLTVLQLTLGGLRTYVWMLGMFALGLESTLPVPQAVQNYRRRSLSGFRVSVLGGWLVGDAFKSVYFIVQGSPVQFVVAGLFALSVDVVICVQLYLFRAQTEQDEEELRTTQAEALEAGRRREAPIEDNGPASTSANRRTAPAHAPKSTAAKKQHVVSESSPFQIEADDDEEEDEDEGDLSRTRR